MEIQTDVWLPDGQMDGHSDSWIKPVLNHNTLHYHVAEYEKILSF